MRQNNPRESSPVWGRRAAPAETFRRPVERAGRSGGRPVDPNLHVRPSARGLPSQLAADWRVVPGGRAGGSGSTGPRSPDPAGAGTGSARLGPPQGLATAPVFLGPAGRAPRGGRHVNDPSAGSPTETLLRLLLPLNDQVWTSFRQFEATGAARNASPEASLNHSIGSSDGRCVQRAGT